MAYAGPGTPPLAEGAVAPAASHKVPQERQEAAKRLFQRVQNAVDEASEGAENAAGGAGNPTVDNSKVPAVAANVQILMRETLSRIGKVAGASAMPPKSALIQT